MCQYNCVDCAISELKDRLNHVRVREYNVDAYDVAVESDAFIEEELEEIRDVVDIALIDQNARDGIKLSCLLKED